MGSREEHGLKLARCSVDTVVQQTVIPCGIAACVGGFCCSIAGDGLFGEEHGHNGTDPVQLTGKLLQNLTQFLFQSGTFHFQFGINLRIFVQDGQLGKTGSHGHRIAGQRTGLIDRAKGSNLLHQIPSAAVSANGHTTADDLAVGDQIGLYLIIFLCTAGSQTETGDDFVENQQAAKLVAQFPQILQKTGRDEQAMLVTVSGIVVVFLMLVGEIGALFAAVRELFGL